MACTCGLYAATSPAILAGVRALAAGPAVVGEIAMWGRVVDHAFGARSQFAYPQRLRLVCGPCLASGRGAVAPTDVIDAGDELVPVCRRHRSELPGETRPAAEIERELLATYAVDLLPEMADLRATDVEPPLGASMVLRARGRAPIRRRSPLRMMGMALVYGALYLFYAYVAIWILIAAVMAIGVVVEAVTSPTPAAAVATPAASPSRSVGSSPATTSREMREEVSNDGYRPPQGGA
jgi:hypothetical protein